MEALPLLHDGNPQRNLIFNLRTRAPIPSRTLRLVCRVVPSRHNRIQVPDSSHQAEKLVWTCADIKVE